VSSIGPIRLPLALPRVARDDDRVVAGVCGGIARALDADVTFVRLTFSLLAFASGAGIVAYVGAWAMLPAPGASLPSRKRRVFGAILLVWGAVLALRGLGVADSIVWPLAFFAAGLVLLGGTTFGLEERRARVAAGVLILIGVVTFVTNNTSGSASTVLAPGAVAIALLLILAPWAWRLAREREAERAARIRTEERADFAARVHDSVLQTLTLIQKDPGDARRLARRQERELRAWLNGRRAPGEQTVASSLEAVAADVEEAHGVPVEVVAVGDAPLDARAEALVAAAREALVNAAKFAPDGPVALFAEVAPERIEVFVRDRGPGFDPARVPADRRGVRESIVGRMERHGGRAVVHTAPGQGTEVELVMKR
jgi:signal transduction histidine kinase